MNLDVTAIILYHLSACDQTSGTHSENESLAAATQQNGRK
jgi:hypothetical protein